MRHRGQPIPESLLDNGLGLANFLQPFGVVHPGRSVEIFLALARAPERQAPRDGIALVLQKPDNLVSGLRAYYAADDVDGVHLRDGRKPLRAQGKLDPLQSTPDAPLAFGQRLVQPARLALELFDDLAFQVVNALQIRPEVAHRRLNPREALSKILHAVVRARRELGGRVGRLGWGDGFGLRLGRFGTLFNE